MSTLSLSVANPCHENWNEFTPTQKGAFCGACSRDVVDFTKMSDPEIIAYFQKAHGKVCGRFSVSQLKDYDLKKSWDFLSRLTFPLPIAVIAALLSATSATAAVTPKTATEMIIPSLGKTKQSAPDTSLVRMITISGVVTDANGTPVPSVYVSMLGQSWSTFADSLGRYSLQIPSDGSMATILFSGVQYLPEEEIVQLTGQDIVVNKVLTDRACLQVTMGAVAYSYHEEKTLWNRFLDFFRKD